MLILAMWSVLSYVFADLSFMLPRASIEGNSSGGTSL